MTDIQNGKMIDPGKKSWNIKAGVFSSCMLHIIAMACMLSDHMWATLFPYVDILTCIGRIAFPIFAFMIVSERLGVCGVLSDFLEFFPICP